MRSFFAGQLCTCVGMTVERCVVLMTILSWFRSGSTPLRPCALGTTRATRTPSLPRRRQPKRTPTTLRHPGAGRDPSGSPFLSGIDVKRTVSSSSKTVVRFVAQRFTSQARADPGLRRDDGFGRARRRSARIDIAVPRLGCRLRMRLSGLTPMPRSAPCSPRPLRHSCAGIGQAGT